MHWVTGTPLGLDGSACVWLVRRFVDRAACFRFVAPEDVSAVALAGAGPALEAVAAMTLAGAQAGRCGFRDLARRHRPDDPTLRALADIVGAACGAGDTGCREGAGLRLMARGFPLVASDDVIAERSGFLFDALYAAVQAYPPAQSRTAREARALAWFWLR
jgi:hypothetical protein